MRGHRRSQAAPRVRHGLRTLTRNARRWRRLVLMIGHTMIAWAVATTRARRATPLGQQALLRELCAQSLRLLGVRVHTTGRLPRPGPALLVANHVSWLDPYAVCCLLRTRCLAKAEVAGWPIVGRMVGSLGTLFIVRGSVRHARRTKERIAEALRNGERVLVFPEGTTTDGRTLRRFHTAMFQAAIDAGVPVQPIALSYHDDAGTPVDAADFIDDMPFVESLLRVAGAPDLRVSLHFGPVVASTDRTRRALATIAQSWIADVLAVERPRAHDEPQRARLASLRRAA